MAIEHPQTMSVEEYFQLEENDPDTRYEYIDGHVYAFFLIAFCYALFLHRHSRKRNHFFKIVQILDNLPKRQFVILQPVPLFSI